MGANDEQAAHDRSATELLNRLGLPAFDATALTWFDGKQREILIWITPKGQRNKQMMIPTTFDGYPVRVERMPKVRPLAA